MNRNRLLYLLYIFLTIALGLASRKFTSQQPMWINLYLGDVLWALMVFFMAGFIFKKKSILWIAALALAFSFIIESSQFYHAEWIDNIRRTRLGGLILGFGFLWSDLICYTAGVGFGYVFENIQLKISKKVSQY